MLLHDFHLNLYDNVSTESFFLQNNNAFYSEELTLKHFIKNVSNLVTAESLTKCLSIL